jgi:hypothetical protein
MIATKVMGLIICGCSDETIKVWKDYFKRATTFDFNSPMEIGRFGSDRTCNCCGRAYLPVIRYSTDIADAWMVVEKLKTRERYIEILAPKGDKHWVCRVVSNDETFGVGADTAPHAICLCALQAVGQ